MRRTQLSAVLGSVLALAACSKDDTPSDACATNADCLGSLVCVDGECVLGDGTDGGATDSDVALDGSEDACTGDCGDADASDTSDVVIPDPIVEVPGACTNGPDQVALHRVDPSECAPCILNDAPVACVESCLSDLSSECLGCFTTLFQCFHDNCADVCATPDDACLACAEANCTDEEECTGRASLPPFEECTSDSDRRTVERRSDDLVIGAAECMATCEGTSLECAESGACEPPSGVSDGCYGCFLQRGECTRDLCAEPCVDPASEACATCRLRGCAEQMTVCTGLDFTPPDDGSGTEGSGTEGSGTEGSGTEGSGTEGSGTEGSGTEGSGEPTPQAYLAVTHIAPDINGISVYVPGQVRPVVRELGFGNSSGVQFIPPGTTMVDVLAADAAPGDEPLVTAVLPVATADGTVITVTVYGEATSRPSTIATFAQVEQGVAEGVRWRAFNGIPGIASVDLYDTTGEAPVRLGGALGFAAATAGTARAAGDFVLGLDTDANGSVDYEFQVGPFVDGVDCTFWIAADASSTPFIIRTLSDGGFNRLNPLAAE
ncbi:MAG: hypothetical protein H6698_00255 [Myxococcales bacterium]|nr:hypothetical protein [Myxococcales bacterium]MCB9521637.1 hypothetical protein [Myxococcales bacterium]MCB9531605.1 hypothetical protein [Myxococcales bacterium]MCB9532743.1 hypothetical protein [Myxococcales bacterium]